MTKEELAQGRIVAAGVARLLTKDDKGREVSALCRPDYEGSTVLHLSVRNDGTPESIRTALELMAASLATMQ